MQLLREFYHVAYHCKYVEFRYEEFSISDERHDFQLTHINGFHPIENSPGDAFRGSTYGSEGFDPMMDKADTDHLGELLSNFL